MLVKIQHMVTLETYDIKYVSKAILVRNFKKLVKEITGVDVKHQNLYFCGKLLNDECNLCNYKIENGYKIEMQVRQPLEPITQKTAKQNESTSSNSDTFDDIPSFSESSESEDDPKEIHELEMAYQKSKNKVIHSKKFLNSAAISRPDKESKLISYIENEEKRQGKLYKALQLAKENIRPTDKNGQADITEEQNVPMLRQKVKTPKKNMANQSDRPKILGDIGSVPNHQKQCPTCKNDYNKSNYVSHVDLCQTWNKCIINGNTCKFCKTKFQKYSMALRHLCSNNALGCKKLKHFPIYQEKKQKEYQAKKKYKGMKCPKSGSDFHSPPHQSSKKQKLKAPQTKFPVTKKPNDPVNQVNNQEMETGQHEEDLSDFPFDYENNMNNEEKMKIEETKIKQENDDQIESYLDLRTPKRNQICTTTKSMTSTSKVDDENEIQEINQKNALTLTKRLKSVFSDRDQLGNKIHSYQEKKEEHEEEIRKHERRINELKSEIEILDSNISEAKSEKEDFEKFLQEKLNF